MYPPALLLLSLLLREMATSLSARAIEIEFLSIKTRRIVTIGAPEF